MPEVPSGVTKLILRKGSTERILKVRTQIKSRPGNTEFLNEAQRSLEYSQGLT